MSMKWMALGFLVLVQTATARDKPMVAPAASAPQTRPTTVTAYGQPVEFDDGSGASCEAPVGVKTLLESAQVRAGAQQAWLDQVYPSRSDETHRTHFAKDNSRAYSEFTFKDQAGSARLVCFDVSDSINTPRSQVTIGAHKLLELRVCSGLKASNQGICGGMIALYVGQCASAMALEDHYPWAKRDLLTAHMGQVGACATRKVSALLGD